jgi:N-acetylmuramoyl-L-alanine amidase
MAMQNVGRLIAFFIAIFPMFAHAGGLHLSAIERNGQTATIVLEYPTAFHHRNVFLLNNPDRLAIDFPKLIPGKLTLPSVYHLEIVRGVRFSQFNASTSRLVFDLNGKATVGRAVYVQKNNRYQLRIPLLFAAAVNSSVVLPKKPERQSEITVIKPLIVIDAGHGGQDPGAISRRGQQEKAVTLMVARVLEKKLLSTGRYRVHLTRSGDQFIPLHERVNIARKRKGQLFISLHADSNPNPQARGLSVYTLSETASDAEAAALAERENKSDIIGGVDFGVKDEEVADILLELTQRETMGKSSELADKVVASLHPKLMRLSNTHRYAGFRVLKAPDIPSVLVELGFLSNVQDEQTLKTQAFMDLFSGSMLRAVDDFFKKHPVK